MPVTQVDEYDPQADPHRLKLVPPVDEPEPTTTIDYNELRLRTIAVLHGLASLLAARLILLLTVLIGGALGGIAAWHASAGSIIASALFNVTVVIPIALLAARKG